MHAHMYNDGQTRMIADTPEKVIGFMERSNVRFMLFASHRVLMEGKAPDYDLPVAREHPDKFKLYFPVLSMCSDPEKDLRIVEENPEYAGFKFLCDYYHTPLEDPRHTPYWEYADAHKMPVLCHTWGGSVNNGVNNARKILEKYHDLSLIAGHSFRGDEDEGVKLGREFGNIYFELTAVLSARNRVEKYLNAGLGKRIVFGVDSPWFSYDSYIGALLSADISDEDRKNMMFRNAAELLVRSGMDLLKYGIPGYGTK